MKLRILVLGVLLLVSLSACASSQLSSEASQAEKLKARCTDAQTALLMADAFLEDIDPSTPAGVYWSSFRKGAQVAIRTYCPVE
jgi:uncharacterized lipoprotein